LAIFTDIHNVLALLTSSPWRPVNSSSYKQKGKSRYDTNYHKGWLVGV